MPSTVDDEPLPPGELPSPAASSPSRAAAAALSLPTAQADLPMSPGRAAAAAIMRGISGMIGVAAALSPAIRHRPPPAELLVGASPFDCSLVESSISIDVADEDSTSITSSNNDEHVQHSETPEKILQMMLEDNAEEGDGGDSDVEGDEVNMHYQAMTANEENHDLDVEEWGEVSDPSIPGAPEGWIPSGAPIGFIGYCPKFDAPSHFSEVDNPGRWSEFVFQPKYLKVKGMPTSAYAGHFTPAGAKVVPADCFGRREVNGWNFFTVDGSQMSLIARRLYEALR